MTKPWVIHVVDDDEPVRTAFAFALQAFGYHVVTYVDANNFLLSGPQERGVLISDMRMPGMNGIELTRLLRRDGFNIRIILMTGHIDDELEADAISAGADLVLTKPLELTTVIAEIARLTNDLK